MSKAENIDKQKSKKRTPSWQSLDKLSKQLEAAREMYVSSNVSFNKLYALFDGLSRSTLTEVAKNENWTLQRTIYQTQNTELLQTLAQSQLSLLIVELNAVNAYAQRLLVAIRDERLSLDVVKTIKIDLDAAISRSRYLASQISAIPIIRVKYTGNIDATIATEKMHKLETVQRWVRMPPSLAESLRKIGLTGKQMGDFYIENLSNLGSLNKAPKASQNEEEPAKANRYYKPHRR